MPGRYYPPGTRPKECPKNPKQPGHIISVELAERLYEKLFSKK